MESRHFLIVLFALLVGYGLSGCESKAGQDERISLSVFAASSLTESFQALARGFEAEHPEVKVELVFAGSQVLRLQIEQGAPADVFASANESHMQALVEGGLVEEAKIFARNELVVIVPRENGEEISEFSDLEKASRIVIGTANVPVGIYTRELFERAEAQFGEEFAAGIRAAVVSEESNVRLARAKVELGEADAAFVYRTDAVATEKVEVVAIPAGINVVASYPIGEVKRSEGGEVARAFVEYVLSPVGQGIVGEHGFLMEEK